MMDFTTNSSTFTMHSVDLFMWCIIAYGMNNKSKCQIFRKFPMSLDNLYGWNVEAKRMFHWSQYTLACIFTHLGKWWTNMLPVLNSILKCAHTYILNKIYLQCKCNAFTCSSKLQLESECRGTHWFNNIIINL